MEERALMRAELNALRSEVASLTQALSDALAAQEQSPEPHIASMDEMGSPGVAALVERYQWPLALAAIALLLGVLVWLRKRREETWEDVPLAEPVAKPTVTPGAAPKAASKTAPMSEAVPIAYPIQANDDDVEEPHQQSEPQVAIEDEPEISYTSAASTANSDQWLIDEQAQTPEQDDTLRYENSYETNYENSYENSYEKSQASGLAEQGRQRRLGLHVAPDNGSDHLSLAPPLSPAPMRLLLASLSADLKSAEPAAPVDHVQPTERAPKGSEDAEHRFIDYHPPTLMNTPSSQEALRTETPMQPTVEFASQPDAEPVSPAKQPRRPIEEEWEIEEVAFKPRGLDNSEPSKSSK
jgi:pilus assembly protein FimV